MPDPIVKIQERLASKGKNVPVDRIKEKLKDPAFREAQFTSYGKQMGYNSLKDFEADLAPAIPSLSFPSGTEAPVAPKQKQDIPSPVAPNPVARGAYQFDKEKKERTSKAPMLGSDEVVDAAAADVAMEKALQNRPPAFYEEQDPQVAQSVRNLNTEIRELKKYRDELAAPLEQGGRTDMEELSVVDRDIAAKIDQRTRFMAENKEKLPIEMLTPREYLGRVPDLQGIKQVQEEFDYAESIEAVQRGESPKVSLSQEEFRHAKSADPAIHRFNAETTANSLYLRELGKATDLTLTTLKSKYGEDILPLLQKANEDQDSLSDKEIFILTELNKDPVFNRLQDQMITANKWSERTAAIVNRYPTVKAVKEKGEKYQALLDQQMTDSPVYGGIRDFATRFNRGVVLNSYKILSSNRFSEYEELAKSKMGVPADGPFWATSTKFSKPFRTKVADFTAPDGQQLQALYSDDGQFAGTYSKSSGVKVSDIDPGLFDPKLKTQTNWSSGAAMAAEVAGDLAVTVLLTRGMGGLASLATASPQKIAALTRWVGTPIASQIQFQNRWIQQGLQEGMTFDQASNYSMGVSAIISLVQPLYGFEADIVEKFSEGMWKGVTARSVQKALTNPTSLLKKAGKVLMDITGESAEEVLENALERYVGNRRANNQYGTNLKTGYKDWNEFKEDTYETAFVTALATGPMSVITNVMDNSTNQSLLRRYFLSAVQDINKYKETIGELRRQGKLDNTKDYYEAELEGISNKHREVFESDKFTDEMKKDLIMHEMQGIQLLNKAAAQKDPNSPQAKAIMQQYDENQQAIAKLLKDKKSPVENKSEITPNVQLQEDKAADQQEPAEVAEEEAAVEQPQQSAVERAVQAVRDRAAGRPVAPQTGKASVDKAAESGNTSVDTKTTTDGKEKVQDQAEGQEVAQDQPETFTVPTSNESAGPTVEVDKATYEEWKKVDDEEKKRADQIRNSPNVSQEQKNKDLKANAMTYAAQKRKVLGTLTEKEKTKAVKLQKGDEVTVGDQTWTIENPSSYGKVKIKNKATGEVQTVDRGHVVPKTILANKKEAIKPKGTTATAAATQAAPQAAPQAVEYTGDKTKVDGKKLNTFHRKAHNAASFLAALGLPIKVVVHTTEESFFQATGTNRSSGVYQDGVIHLNEQASLDKNELNTRSIHESWHPIISHIKAADKQLYRNIRKFMFKEAKKNPTLAKILNEFVQRYKNANASAIAQGEKAPFSDPEIEEEAMTEFLTQVADNPNMLTMNGKQSLAKSVLSTFRRYSRFFVGTDNRPVSGMTEEELVDIIQAAAAAFSGDLSRVNTVKEKLITRATFDDFDTSPDKVLSLRDWAFLPTEMNVTAFGEGNSKKVEGGYIVINTPIQDIMNQASIMGLDGVITPDGIVNGRSGTLVPISDRAIVNQDTTFPSFNSGKNKISVIPVTGAGFRRKGKNSLLPQDGPLGTVNQELLKKSQFHPDKSPFFSELTADGDDFLFYHYSEAPRKFIDPAYAGTGVTPADESRDMAGGRVSMWYSRQEVKEPQVPGQVQHIVRIPMDQVYDFESDPLGFREEAKSMFKEANPDRAFNSTAQVAWVTKIAADNGFPITVARWGAGGLVRAHSAYALQPSYVADNAAGEQNPSFPSNKSLGWAQIAPPLKQQQLNRLYEAMSEFYSQKKAYDADLYNIRKMGYYDFSSPFAPFKNQDEITEAVENSDLPNRYKELYKTINEGGEVNQRSVFLGPGHDVQYSGNQATLADFLPTRIKQGVLYMDNWAIMTAENPMAQQLSDEENAQRNTQMAQRLVDQGFQFASVNGKYGNPEKSFIITGISPNQALELGREFDQETVITRYGMMYQDGTMHPMTGGETYEQKPDDFYTEFGGGYFALQFDRDKRIPLNQKHSLIPESTFWDNTSLITNASAWASSKKYSRGRDFGIELQDRFAKEYLPKLKKIYGRDFDPQKMNDPRVMDYLAKAFAEEMKIAIKGFPDAIGWYDHKVKAAMAVMSLLHPEITEQRDHEIAMKMAIAITSNGNKVEQNFFEAERQYTVFKKTGKFDAEASVGAQADAIKKSLWMINSLLDEGHTMEDLHDFMTTKYTAGDLFFRDKDGKKVKIAADELSDEIVYGAIVLGPKIGNGFYMNLNGAYDQLTIDRWFMKTWGRLTGKTVNIDKAVLSKAKARITNAQKSLTAEDKKLLRKNFPEVLKGTAMERAAAVFKTNQKQENRDIFGTSKTLDEYRTAANNYAKKEEGSIMRPQNGSQRKWIREVFQAAIDQLAQEGITITNADAQAAIWYPEKALYDATGADMSFEQAANEQSEDLPDYEQAAIKLAESNGISRERIDDAIGRSLEQGSEGDGVRPVRNDHTAEERIQRIKTAVEEAAKARRERNKKKHSLIPPAGMDATTKAQLFGVYGKGDQEIKIDIPSDFTAIGVEDGAILKVGDSIKFPSLLEAFPSLASATVRVQLNPFNEVGTQIDSITPDPNNFQLQATVTGATTNDINKGIVDVLREAAREMTGYNQPRMSLLPDHTRILRESLPEISQIVLKKDREEFVDTIAQDMGVDPMDIIVGLANLGLVWEYKGKKLGQSVLRGMSIGIPAEMNSFYDVSDSTMIGEQMARYAESVIGWGSPDAFRVLMEEVDDLDTNPETRSAAVHLLIGMVNAYSNLGEDVLAQQVMTRIKEIGSASGQVLEALKSIHRNNPLPSMASVLLETFLYQNEQAGVDEAEVNSSVAELQRTTQYTPEQVETATMTAEMVRQAQPVQENVTVFNQFVSQVRGIFSKVFGKQSLLDDLVAGNGVQALSETMIKMVDKGTTAAQAVYYALRALDKVNKEYEAANGTPIFASNEEILDFFRSVLAEPASGMLIPTGTYINLHSPYKVNLTELAKVLDYSVTPAVILKQLVSYVYSSNNVGGKHLSEMIMSSPFFASYTHRQAMEIEKAVAEEMKKKYGERVKNDIANLVKSITDKLFFGQENVQFKANIRSAVEKIADAYNYGLLFDDNMKAMVAGMYLGDEQALDAINRIIELSRTRAKTTSSLVHRKIDREASYIAFKANPSRTARWATNFFAYTINGLLSGFLTLAAATISSLFVTGPRVTARTTYMFARSVLDVLKGKEFINPFAFLVDHFKSGQMKEVFMGAVDGLLRSDSRADHKQVFFGDSTIQAMGGVRPQSDVDRALSNGFEDMFKAWKKAKTPKAVGAAMAETMTTLVTMPLRVTSILKVYEQAVASMLVPYLAYTEAIDNGRARGLQGDALLEYARKKAGYGNLTAAHSAAKREMENMASIPELSHMFKHNPDGSVARSSNGLPLTTFRYKDLYGTLVEDQMLKQADNDFTVMGEFLYKDMQMMGQPEGRIAVGALAMAGKLKPDILGKYKDKGEMWSAIIKSMFGYALFPFARMMAQTISVTYQYSVFGAINSAAKHASGNKETYVGETTGRTIPKPFIGKLTNDKVVRRIKSNAELYEQYLMVAGSLVAGYAFMFMTMFDWDDDDNLVLKEDRPIDVTFRLTGNSYRNTLQAPDQEVLSIRFKNDDGSWGTWMSYRFAMAHIPVLATIGSMRDDITFSDEGMITGENALLKLVSAPLMALTEQTFAMTLNTMTKAFNEFTYASQKKGTDEMVQGVGEIVKMAAVDVLARSFRTCLSAGNFTRDLYADLVKAPDPEGGITSNKAETLPEEVAVALFKDSPVFEKLILGERDKIYDSFGNMIPREFKTKELAELTAQSLIGPIPAPLLNTPFAAAPMIKNLDLTPKKNEYMALPEMKLISKFPRVPAPGKYRVPPTMVNSQGKIVILKESTKKDMQMDVALNMRQYIRDNYDALDQFTEPQLKSALKLIFQDAAAVMKWKHGYLGASGVKPVMRSPKILQAVIMKDELKDAFDASRTVEEQ